MATNKGRPTTAGHARLRQHAEERIQSGTAPRTGEGILDIETLELLYQGALNPESAADAVQFLHELQTHQVELDLLCEQLKANEEEQSEELTHYRTLFEQAPMAYLVMDVAWDVVEANEAAGTLLGKTPEALVGQTFSGLFGADDKAAVLEVMKKLQLHDQAPSDDQTTETQLNLISRDPLIIRATPSPSRDCLFMLLGDAPVSTPH